ncbi:MAG: hypothetical protein HN509_13770 [Halobacteriovoraceae bacterium]|jgi:hypothetical protein|nr:hypothetical protein [Halobacteriovoraceae bacterium]MBT5094892.1 hypothetical protein [Halobacteriovoraceae bacterium]
MNRYLLWPAAILFTLISLSGTTLFAAGPQEKSSSSTVEEISEYLKPGKIRTKVKEKIAELSIGGKVRLFDLDIMEGINFSGNYKIEVEPSYADGFYTRVDKWNMKAGVNVGDLFEASSPAYLNVSRDQEIVFVRQFKKQLKALSALPLSPYRLPLTAKKAIKDLDPGTFVSIPARLNIAVGANAFASSGGITAKAGAFYVISGEFMVHIFRLKDNRVRLKLIAVRKRGRGFNASADVGFEVFGVSILDKQIKKLVDTNLLKIGFIKEKGQLFMIDYLMNLNDPEVQKAYNSILSSTRKFNPAKLVSNEVVDVFTEGKNPADLFISDLTKAEKIFQADRNKADGEKRIERIFKGTNEFARSALNLKLGINLAKLKKTNAYTENFLTYFNTEDEQQNLVYANYLRANKFKFLFGLSEQGTDRNSFILLRADATGAITDNGFSDYGYSYQRKDKNFTRLQQKKIHNFLKVNLPKSYYDKIKWETLLTKDSQKKARVFYRVLFKETTIDRMLDLPKKTLKKKLKEAVARYRGDYLNIIERLTWGQKIVLNWQSWRLGRKLAKVLKDTENNISRRERMENFLKLHRDPLYNKIFLGFYLSLLDQKDLANGVDFELKWSSDQVESATYRFGTHQRRELLTSLEYIQSTINGRSFDLRLVGYDPDKEMLEDEVERLEKVLQEEQSGDISPEVLELIENAAIAL